MKVAGKVVRRKGRIEAIVDGHSIRIEKAHAVKGLNPRDRPIYDSIYRELRSGETVFIEHTQKHIGTLVTNFNHGDEEWYRQHLMDPARISQKLTSYQKRVLEQTSMPTGCLY